VLDSLLQEISHTMAGGGMYRIENTASDHAGVLKYTMLAWGEKQPDIFLVSKEGVKVYTQRILLSFYSSMIREVLEESKDDLAGVSVPASSCSLTMMLKVLVSGSVIGNNKEDLLQIGHAAEALGIVLNDRQIGYRRKNGSQVAGKGMLGGKMSQSKSSDSVPGIKTEQTEDVENKADLRKNRNTSEVKTENPSKYACPTCGKVFGKTDKLRRHMNVHKNEKEKPFKCDVCEKTFSSSSGLKTHKLLHSGELLKCEFCEYTNVQKGNLKTHRMKVHREELDNMYGRGVESDADLNIESAKNSDVDQADTEVNTEGAENVIMEQEVTDNIDVEQGNLNCVDIGQVDTDVHKDGEDTVDLEEVKDLETGSVGEGEKLK